jgi:hypothetical protein
LIKPPIASADVSSKAWALGSRASLTPARDSAPGLFIKSLATAGLRARPPSASPSSSNSENNSRTLQILKRFSLGIQE